MLLLQALIGKLKQNIPAGTDTNLKIRGDRLEALLKNGQTVYYGLKIRPVGECTEFDPWERVHPKEICNAKEKV